jgi:hypothetical protein
MNSLELDVSKPPARTTLAISYDDWKKLIDFQNDLLQENDFKVSLKEIVHDILQLSLNNRQALTKFIKDNHDTGEEE